MILTFAIVLQILVLAYHQITTQLDFFPFNGARFYKRWEKNLECGVNAILMSLGPVGFIICVRGLMWYGVIYYFVLFAEELRVWWVPYFFGPSKAWREAYERLHSQTIIVLPARGDKPIPNLEHMILHGLTFVTAVVTVVAFVLQG